ncbi:MAG: MaoC family dehydratase N-terminal domain-containing protein [Burkholderiales bacterium]|nr:MAG: MaoC family dehydratase N-terminal domain-containing protein [Burkholderiales bacterium]
MEPVQVSQEDFAEYVGMRGEPLVAAMPLEPDTLRRFAQAIMDTDPLYYDGAYAGSTRYGGLVAPPLYPVHAFRPPPGGADPLDAVREDPDADGSGGNDGVFFGVKPIASPFKRLLNGGNEIEFYRCLAVGERTVARARYADIRLKQGKSGALLLVVVETEFRTEAGDLLLINRQTLIWR